MTTYCSKLYKLYKATGPGKLFEVMDYPGKKHSIRGKGTGIHLYRTITDFFDRSIGSKRPQ